jgi:glycosyltransferase 2 family protein
MRLIMRDWWRRYWPVLKTVVALIILAAIGRWFVLHLRKHPEIWERRVDPTWLAVAAAVYLVGLGFSATYWVRLLHVLGQRPSTWAAVRAYYLGHLGKYVPGKAVALLMRATMVRGPGVRLGVAGLTTFYEVLTTMAAATLLAAGLFALQIPASAPDFDWREFVAFLSGRDPGAAGIDPRMAVLLALLMLVPLGVPLLPVFHNRLVRRVSARIREEESPSLPHLPATCLLEGLLVTAVGWLFLGVSLFAVLRAVVGPDVAWSWDGWLRLTAALSLSYVAGFVFVLIPNGLGVREFLLNLFLLPQLVALTASEEVGAATAALTVWLLRLVWFAAELVLSGVIYWLRPSPTAVSQADVPHLPEHKA